MNQRLSISATFPVWSHRENLGLNSVLPRVRKYAKFGIFYAKIVQMTLPRLQRESLWLQKFSVTNKKPLWLQIFPVTNTVLSLPFSQQIQLCIPHDSVYMSGPHAGKSENGFFRCDTWLQIFQNDPKICEAEVTLTPLINTIGKPCRYHWKIATRPETQITHTRGGKQSLAPIDINTREKKQQFTAVFLRWIRRAISLESPTLVNLYIERRPFTVQLRKWP